MKTIIDVDDDTKEKTRWRWSGIQGLNHKYKIQYNKRNNL